MTNYAFGMKPSAIAVQSESQDRYKPELILSYWKMDDKACAVVYREVYNILRSDLDDSGWS